MPKLRGVWDDKLNKFVPVDMEARLAERKEKLKRAKVRADKQAAAKRALRARRKAEAEAKAAAEAGPPEVVEAPTPPQINPVEASDEDVLKMMRAKGDADLFYFATEICEFGHNSDPQGPRITEDQRELIEWIQLIAETPAIDPETQEHLFINFVFTSRDTLKSTCLTALHLWILATKDPNHRILLYGEVHEQAKKRLAVMKRVIQSGNTFRKVYGELDGSKFGYQWNEDKIVIATRTSTATREASVETAGLDVVVNSLHFDMICPDDLHSENNSKTKDQIENVRDKFKLLLPLLSNGGKILGAGVFWGDADVHNWIMTLKGVRTFIRSCYADEAETITRYPHALPIPKLESYKEIMRDDWFSCQYRMDPVPKKSQKFREEWFTIVPRGTFKNLRVYLLVDQAGDPTAPRAQNRDSDYTGMVVVGVAPSGDWLLMDFFEGKISPIEQVEQAIVFIMRHAPYIVGVERAGVGNLHFYIREELRKRGKYAIVEELTPQGRSKYMRVMQLEPQARRRKIFIAQEAQMREEFIGQATRFPKAKHDDIIDPLGYLPDLLKKYGTPIGEVDPNEVPPELVALNADSRNYWMSERRSGNPGADASMGEFT